MKAINGDGLESDSTKSTLQRVAKRFKFIIIEKDLEFLRCSLHRLESVYDDFGDGCYLGMPDGFAGGYTFLPLHFSPNMNAVQPS
jgi:hypothetical protein